MASLSTIEVFVTLPGDWIWERSRSRGRAIPDWRVTAGVCVSGGSAGSSRRRWNRGREYGGSTERHRHIHLWRGPVNSGSHGFMIRTFLWDRVLMFLLCGITHGTIGLQPLRFPQSCFCTRMNMIFNEHINFNLWVPWFVSLGRVFSGLAYTSMQNPC